MTTCDYSTTVALNCVAEWWTGVANQSGVYRDVGVVLGNGWIWGWKWLLPWPKRVWAVNSSPCCSRRCLVVSIKRCMISLCPTLWLWMLVIYRVYLSIYIYLYICVYCLLCSWWSWSQTWISLSFPRESARIRVSQEQIWTTNKYR